MHSQAARCVCVYRFICLQCQNVTFIPTKNKYSARNELKQEEEQDEAEEEEEVEEEGSVRSLAHCLSGRNANCGVSLFPVFLVKVLYLFTLIPPTPSHPPSPCPSPVPPPFPSPGPQGLQSLNAYPWGSPPLAAWLRQRWQSLGWRPG